MTHHCISNHIILESNSRLAENVGQQSAPLTVKNRGWELATSRLTLVCRYLCLLTKFWPILYFVGEEAMATHSSTLARQIPWMEEPDGLQSMELQRVRHDWVTSLSLFTFMHWRRKLQPTPVFLPGESQGLGSLVGCRLWDRTELDMTSSLAAAAAELVKEIRPACHSRFMESHSHSLGMVDDFRLMVSAYLSSLNSNFYPMV